MSLPALPQQHVPRPRLVRALLDSPVGLIEAGGGYGKSVLAAELRRELGTASAEAVARARHRHAPSSCSERCAAACGAPASPTAPRR